MPETSWSFDVDIVGRCNLSCPSCPVGNMAGTPLQSGYMSPKLLDQIVGKAVSECNVTNFALYNWTEPFIHPKLPEMISVVKAHNIGCDISTNLNLAKQIDAVVSAKPDTIKISVSGFNQKSYGTTHRGGNIELVKQNMQMLADAKKSYDSPTRILVIFHRYLDNQDEESSMRKFAFSLDFDFTTYWAYLMPLEKNLAFLKLKPSVTQFTKQDKALVNQLAFPLEKALSVARDENVSQCRLRDNQMAINSEGKVMLCCSVFDQSKYLLADYLDTPIQDLQKMKHSHEMCTKCMQAGLHVMMTFGDNKLPRFALRLEKMIRQNIQDNNPELDVKKAYGPYFARESHLIGLKRKFRNLFFG